jgi:hypothetical protein
MQPFSPILGAEKSTSHQGVWVFALKYARIGEITRQRRDYEEPMLIRRSRLYLGEKENSCYTSSTRETSRFRAARSGRRKERENAVVIFEAQCDTGRGISLFESAVTH